MRLDVTKTFLPPLGEYMELLKGVWDTGWITNHGELVNRLEHEIALKLGLQNFSAVNNGTTALQIAIKSLGLTGEIITTPFSYVATTSSIVWENCQPVFVDIEPETLTIDPKKIESAITDKTSAIVATHVFGNPCDVDTIADLSKKHGLKVIYDAAHAFNVRYRSRSIFSYGDISTVSFHATKLYHTVEGGGIVCSDQQLHEKCMYMRNFGHNGQEDFFGLGINGKLSELNAAMGILNLKYFDQIQNGRMEVSNAYDQLLSGFRRPTIRKNSSRNYSYYPLIFDSEEILIRAMTRLQDEDIYPRRYFYPSLTTLPYINNPRNCPIAKGISERILCLPLSDALNFNDVERICFIINRVVKTKF